MVGLLVLMLVCLFVGWLVARLLVAGISLQLVVRDLFTDCGIADVAHRRL